MSLFGLAVMPSVDNAAASSLSIGENYFKIVVGPVIVVTANLLFKTLSEIRSENLTRIRLVIAMRNEVEMIYQSLGPYTTTFAAAYDHGNPRSLFAQKIAADPRYFPYSVANRSATAVFIAEPAPARTFNFLRSEVMWSLIAFHDPASLLHVSIADMRDDLFRDLEAGRKLEAIGNVVRLLTQVQAAYKPCCEALDNQEELLTSRSLWWHILFPIRSGSYLFWILSFWILGNMLWQSMVR